MKLRTWLAVGAVTLAGALGIHGQEGEPLRIALMSDQSGALALYGTELENGFKLGLLYSAGVDVDAYDNIDDALAQVTIAGRPVEVLVRDTKSDPDTGASEARAVLEQEGAEIMVGAPSSGVTVGLQQVALDYEVVLFAAPGASPAITGAGFNVNTFRACRNTAQDALALASFATEGLGTKWIILAADYEFGRASEAAFKATLGAFGVEFVADTIFAPLETTDFTPYLQQVLDSGAEAMLPIWAGDTSVALFQQIAELGVNTSLNVVGAFNSNDIVAASDPSTIGNVSWIVYHYSFPQNEINDWLTTNHRKFYNNDVPDLFTECGFATAQALYNAVTATEGDTLPEALIPALEGLVWEGPKGTYYMRPGDHQALVPMYIARLTNLDDPDQKFYELLSEVSAFAAAPPCALPEGLQERCALNDAFIAEVNPDGQ
jgi:branched-chain amino acid transport system substrate-binding protein